MFWAGAILLALGTCVAFAWMGTGDDPPWYGVVPLAAGGVILLVRWLFV